MLMESLYFPLVPILIAYAHVPSGLLMAVNYKGFLRPLPGGIATGTAVP